MQKSSLDSDVLCVDSLKIFRKMSDSKSKPVLKDPSESEITNNDNKSELTAVMEEFFEGDMARKQMENERTPCKRIIKNSTIDRTPYQRPKACRSLFPASTSTNGNGNVARTPQKTRVSFRLSDIYERLFDESPQAAHNAEADTLLLLKCAIATKEEFVQIASTDSIKLCNIKPL